MYYFVDSTAKERTESLSTFVSLPRLLVFGGREALIKDDGLRLLASGLGAERPSARRNANGGKEQQIGALEVIEGGEKGVESR